jgi:hypothetical protein
MLKGKLAQNKELPAALPFVSSFAALIDTGF